MLLNMAFSKVKYGLSILWSKSEVFQSAGGKIQNIFKNLKRLLSIKIFIILKHLNKYSGVRMSVSVELCCNTASSLRLLGLSKASDVLGS